jgi:hypothetical protein
MVKAVSEKQKETVRAGLARLHTWNIWLAAVYALQGIFVILVSATRLLPIEATYKTTDPLMSGLVGHEVIVNATKHLFDVNLVYMVAAIFFVAAAMHLIVATVYRNQYEAELKKGVNRARWIEYTLSVALLFVVMAIMIGFSNIVILLLLFAVAVIMNGTRMAVDLYHAQHKNRSNRLLAGLSIFADVALWLVIVLMLWAAGAYSSAGISSFILVLISSAFVLFAGFAVTMYLQYRKIGKWADYLYGERVYMILAFVAKTALVWQIVAGALQP